MNSDHAWPYSDKPDVDSMTQFTSELVKISTQAGMDDGDRILTFTSDWLTRRGIKPEVVRTSRGRDVGLVCEVEGESEGPTYVLDACLDTAPVGDPGSWTIPPRSGAILDGWLYGRGSADCKSGVSIFSHIGLEALKQRHLMSGRLTMLFDLDEHTGGFAGAKSYFGGISDPSAIGGVYIGYPGDRRIVVGSRGFYRATVTVYGKASHSGSSRAQGTNAINKAAELVLQIEKKPPNQGARPRDDSFPIGPQVTVTRIRGGAGFSIVPDKCDLNIDIRLTPDFDALAASAWLENIIRQLDDGMPSPKPTGIRKLNSWPAYRLDSRSRLASNLKEGAEWALGREVPLEVTGPSNIANYLAAGSIEATAGFGVDYRNIHAPDERVRLASFEPAFIAYRFALSKLLQQSE